MFGFWYNSSMRNYIVMMGDLFSHVQVMRKHDDGIKLQKVPITFASKEHFAEKMRKLNSVNSELPVAKVETILPRMSLSLVDLIYNTQFKTSSTNVQIQNLPKSIDTLSQFNSAPYKMIFELGIYTRHQDDMFQIIEQILPYFQPHFTTRITELHNNVIFFDRDIRVVLQSVAIADELEGEVGSRRRLEWTLIFEVNGWLYPPSANIEGQIRTIYLDFFANQKTITVDNDHFESFDVQVDPLNIPQDEWELDPKILTSDTSGIPIPKDPDPSGVRKPK